ncbi:hypothetical protein QE152_g37987 [Popillia japonica]|uniref:Uncharacterized protein n=1 Tax=Popillia japonica TaxID=7064 RepID=A0AAW1I8R3_POPJA
MIPDISMVVARKALGCEFVNKQYLSHSSKNVKASSTSSSGNLTVSKDEIAFIVQSRDDVKHKEITWYLDSGASEHMLAKKGKR